jgi:hypothetical protein
MQDLDLLQSLNVIPNFTPVIEPILASGQEAPVVRVQPSETPIAAFTQSLPTQPTVSAQPVSTNRSLPQQEQKFSDYGAYGYIGSWVKDECCARIPDYRLATSCANCAFSTYEPVNGEAICKKWNQRVVPFYYCDSHVDPASLLGSSDSQEVFSEPAQPVLAAEVQPLQTAVSTNSEFPDQELYEEAKRIAPSFVNQAGEKVEALTNLFIIRMYEQLVKEKSLKAI